MSFRKHRAVVASGWPTRVLFTAVLFLTVALCSAKPDFVPIFKNLYKVDPASALGKATCGICHTSPPTKNAYGKTLKKAIDASSGGTLTPEILKAAESIDSDGDGWTNGDEIREGFFPGDPASHPEGKPGAGAGTPKADTTASPLIPTHAFHPVVVHFPIALFIFGLFLEFVGLWKKNPTLGVAALWNLAGGLASLAIVAPTGVAAWLMGGHKLEGNMLIHLILAITALLTMSGTLIARKKFGNTSKVYWAILLIATVVVGLTGHFGGQMVYG